MTQQQFPDPEERARIMARRNQLNRDLIEYLVMHSSDEQEAREQMNPLVREYGFPEVYRMLQKTRRGGSLHPPNPMPPKAVRSGATSRARAAAGASTSTAMGSDEGAFDGDGT